MSGRTQQDAISFLDDEDADPILYEQDQLDVQAYDEVEDSENDAPINDDEKASFSFSNIPPAPVSVPALEEFEIPSFTLECGNVRPGQVVELVDDSGRQSDHLISGDFLLVRHIIENVRSGEVVLRGYQMRRCTYLMPLFDGKFNELFMLLEVRENDPRPRFVQGLKDIQPEKVKDMRKCAFTHLSYDALRSRNVNTHVPARLTTQGEMREWLFQHGKLLCRWVYVVELHPTSQSCGGEARRMYKREVSAFTDNQPLRTSGTLPTSAKCDSPGYSRKRTQSVADTNTVSRKERSLPLAEKSKTLALADIFCGCGGVSEGGRQAGYKIVLGLDFDRLAMEAYRKNFPEATALEMNAHDFPGIARRCYHSCDHLHMSCPCCYWSQCHTVDGPNDEANMMTIFTVEPTLRKLKPSTFSLEQAPGLLTLPKHRIYFRSLINGILSSGYHVRWRIQDQAWFGVSQHRRRLVFVGAKIGKPLPPFPAPTHGPPGSQLNRFVTIEDSLKILEHQARMFDDDPYHQPQNEKRLNKPAIDPHVNLANCITTSGGDNVHYTGTRVNTVRELASFQGFPPNFHFTGPITEARKQCGNAWPVKANKAYLLLWAATREAFDYGLINEEDEILDLYDFLEAKGITIPEPPSIDIDMLDGPTRQIGTREPEYRYLNRIRKTVKPNIPLSLWSRSKEIEPKPKPETKAATRYPSLLDGLLDGTEKVAGPTGRRKIFPNRRRPNTVDDPILISDSE